LPVEKTELTASVVDVLDRVLDKGIVIDAWVKVSVAGLDTVQARLVVASIETYLTHSNIITRTLPLALRSI
jgi:hypothetical protein